MANYTYWSMNIIWKFHFVSTSFHEMKRIAVMVCVWVYNWVTPFYFDIGMELASWTPPRSGNTKLTANFLMPVLWGMMNPELFVQHFGAETIQQVRILGLTSLLTFSESISLLQEMTWLQAPHWVSRESRATGITRWRCHTASPSVIAPNQECKMTHLI